MERACRRFMNRVRLNNATVFVTVLSACLGLVVIGATSQSHRTSASVLSELASAASANLSYSHSSNQGLKLAAAFSSSSLPLALKHEANPAETLYKNTRALNDRDKILVITRRAARASLENLAA